MSLFDQDRRGNLLPALAIKPLPLPSGQYLCIQVTTFAFKSLPLQYFCLQVTAFAFGYRFQTEKEQVQVSTSDPLRMKIVFHSLSNPDRSGIQEGNLPTEHITRLKVWGLGFGV